MMTMLLRTGVHIIAPNLPRALRICPITTWIPMKKIVGRKYRVKVMATSLAAMLPATGTDSMRTRSGAANIASTVSVPRATMTRVSRRFA